jgi:hypothetical protein
VITPGLSRYSRGVPVALKDSSALHELPPVTTHGLLAISHSNLLCLWPLDFSQRFLRPPTSPSSLPLRTAHPSSLPLRTAHPSSLPLRTAHPSPFPLSKQLAPRRCPLEQLTPHRSLSVNTSPLIACLGKQVNLIPTHKSPPTKFLQKHKSTHKRSPLLNRPTWAYEQNPKKE